VVKEAQKAISQMLDQLPNDDRVTLSELEQATGEMGAAIMREALQNLSETVEMKPKELVRCPKCDQPMQARGKRRRQVVTLRGESELVRHYYSCPHCGQGYFPPG